MITEHSVDFVRECARDSDPFFVYTSYNAPHYPMHAPQEYMDRFDHLPWDKQIMAAMIAGVDDGVGRIIQALEAEGIRDDTFIFFSSDNGPSRETRNWLDGTKDPYYGGTTGGLKGHKGTLWDGGIRMPAIMSWPGTIEGGQVSDEVGIMMDIFPTMLEAVGGDPSRYDLDGESLLDMVANGGENPHDWIAWNLRGQRAIRRGPWKLVLNGQFRDGRENPDPVWLSQIEDDFSEQNNLADEAPEEVWYLREILDPWAEEQNRLISEQRAEFDARGG
jgi:arylsulfatase A-like enzyme